MYKLFIFAIAMTYFNIYVLPRITRRMAELIAYASLSFAGVICVLAVCTSINYHFTEAKLEETLQKQIVLVDELNTAYANWEKQQFVQIQMTASAANKLDNIINRTIASR
jgi:hypothetical protein